MKNILLLSFILLAISCKRENDANANAVITITSPTANQHFNNGEEIRITGTITHSTNLVDAGVHLKDNSNGYEIFHNHDDVAPNKTSHSFDIKYTINTGKKTFYTIEIETSDINKKVFEKEMIISLN